jgi:hypothetical protein
MRSTPIPCPDCAIGLMVCTFSRVGAAVSMRVEDYFVQGRRGWVRLHEKGGKEHAMPTQHNLDRYLDEYLQAVGIAADRKGPLFRTTRGRTHRKCSAPVRCLADDSPAHARGRDLDGDRLPHLAPPASPPTSRTAAASRSPSRWPPMSQPGRPASTTAAATRSRSMRSRESGSREDTWVYIKMRGDQYRLLLIDSE